MIAQIRATRMVGVEQRSDVPRDVVQAIAAAKRTMGAAIQRLSLELYTQRCRWLLELLQNADDNEYDRLPGTVCGVGGSDGREASDLAPAAEAAAAPQLQLPQPPQVDIMVSDSHVELRNNERGFSARDVEALW